MDYITVLIAKNNNKKKHQNVNEKEKKKKTLKVYNYINK
jgi:hypothetical protein